MATVAPQAFLYEDVWFVDEVANIIFYAGGFVPLEVIVATVAAVPERLKMGVGT